MPLPMIKTAIVLTLCGMAVQAMSEPMSEEAALSLVLRNNTAVAVTWLTRERDSLDLVSARTAWLPQFTLAASTVYGPFDNPVTSAAAGIDAKQALPGGATLAAGTHYGNTHLPQGDSGSATYSASISQPLLHGAWTNAAVACQIELKTMADGKDRLNLKQQLSTELTDVRNLYYDCLSAREQLRIAQGALASDSAQLERQRARFSIGEATVVDTLKALLKKLESRQLVLTNKNDLRNKTSQLALKLVVPSDSITFPESLSVTLSDLPDEATLERQIEAYDPGLKGDEIDKSIYETKLRLAKNALLPDLGIGLAYGYTSANGLSDNASIAHNSRVQAQLNYTLPTRVNRIALHQAEIDVKAQRLNAALHIRSLHDLVVDVVAGWRLGKEQLAVAAATVDVARRTLEASVKGFELGMVSRLDLEDSQNAYIAAAVGYVTQQMVLKKQEIAIENYTGAVFSRFGVSIK
jgi:outer membrane protein TolC